MSNSYYTISFKATLLLLLYVSSSQTLTNATSTFLSNTTAHMALIAFQSKISIDPHGIFKSWNDSIHFCHWEGITCSRRRERVTTLDLSSRGLVGFLSPFLGNLSFLREIRLSNNSFHGDIPPEIGCLFRLEMLFLNDNSFEGELPSNLSHCSNLNVLEISDNKLEGKLPMELASMSKLNNISIHDNHFTGGIPPFIGNLTALVSLSAADNDFGGNIPEALGQLRSLRFLALGGNNLSGKMPPSIYNLSMLSNFSIRENQLEGNILWDIGLTLPHLMYFQIWGNHFSGQIPVTIANASKLQFVEMEENKFTGKVRVPFGHLQHLQRLHLGYNHLGSREADEMDFLTSLANCSELTKVYLDGNEFYGRLPDSIANFSNQLTYLVLQYNKLFGDIPSGLGNLIRLNSLELENNQFTGKIPKEIGKLKQLNYISLNDNKLSGEIPDSFGNLTHLLFLYLDHNRLNGSIPSSLGNCQTLLRLDLSENYLSGPVPKELFSIFTSLELDLSHNHLVGSLPSEVGHLRNLEKLDVSNNMLSGEIPSSLIGCTSLEFLYLDGNHIQGSIPQILSSLRGIRKIGLSSNNLTGKIPQYLEKLTLEYLNLSFNNLEGEIPTKGVFSNASAIFIEGNKNLCGGIAELGFPKCNIKATKKGELSHVHAVIIVISLLGVIIVSLFLLCWTRRKNREQPSGSSLKEPLRQLSYHSLHRATNGFSTANLLGKGSFGCVYKGVLEDGTNVAVKVLDLQHQGASKSFMAECEALRNSRHRNLVKIITSCSSIDFQGNDFKALVYELMPNGSLENWLHSSSQETKNGQSKVQSLNLLQRISIAIDVASALDYLHYHCGKAIVHCDLKPSNVLLDNNMIAHVGDFGLARFILVSKMLNESSSSVGVRGTIGYAAPEYGMGSEVSIQGDLYSYGILVLEMMTGKRPTDNLFEGGLNLHTYARMALPDQITEIVDTQLLQEAEATIVNRQRSRINIIMDCLVSTIKIGVACSMESPQDRMITSVVLSELHLIKNNLQRI